MIEEAFVSCLLLMNPRKLTDGQEETLALEYLEGATIKGLADRYGCSNGTVQNALRRQKTPKRSRREASTRRKRLTDEQELALIKGYRGGLSMEKLGGEFTCSPVTVRNTLVRHGIPRRGCGRPSQPITPTKRCSACRRELLRSAFYGEGKRSSECQDCLSQKAADRYESDAHGGQS